MTQFDREMKIFEEIKNKYKPIAGFHLVLDLDAYKEGEEIITKFEFGSEEYFYLVSIERHEKNKEIVLISSYAMNTMHYFSKALRARYDYDKDLLLEFEDYAPNPYKLNRSLRHEMELLVYELTHPKPDKPAC